MIQYHGALCRIKASFPISGYIVWPICTILNYFELNREWAWEGLANFYSTFLQLPNVIPSLHLNYGVLAVASGTEVITYDTSQRTLKELSVSAKGTYTH